MKHGVYIFWENHSPRLKTPFFVPTYQDSQDVFFYGKTGKINNQEEHLLDFCVISMKRGKEKNINIKVHLKFFSHQIISLETNYIYFILKTHNFFGEMFFIFFCQVKFCFNLPCGINPVKSCAIRSCPPRLLLHLLLWGHIPPGGRRG